MDTVSSFTPQVTSAPMAVEVTVQPTPLDPSIPLFPSIPFAIETVSPSLPHVISAPVAVGAIAQPTPSAPARK